MAQRNSGALIDEIRKSQIRGTSSYWDSNRRVLELGRMKMKLAGELDLALDVCDGEVSEVGWDVVVWK